MANRSMLYATDVLPGTAGALSAEAVGLSEWSYDIPLVYRLLVSAAPRACPSRVWDATGDIAIAGDYAGGVERLTGFLDRLARVHPTAAPLARDALAFLRAPENRRAWIVLEGGEIFAMGDDDAVMQNDRLLASLATVGESAEAALARQDALEEDLAAPSFWERLFGNARPERQDSRRVDAVRELGLGQWSGVLYYDLSAPTSAGDDGTED